MSKTSQKKLIRDVLNPKTCLKKFRVDFNFSQQNSLSKSSVRRMLKKYGVHSRIAAKELGLVKKQAENKIVNGGTLWVL